MLLLLLLLLLLLDEGSEDANALAKPPCLASKSIALSLVIDGNEERRMDNHRSPNLAELIWGECCKASADWFMGKLDGRRTGEKG